MKKALLSTGVKDDWETPPEFFRDLDQEFHFTLDPCCQPETAKCPKFFTPEDDGLSQSWGGEVVFCNPPYSNKKSDPNRQDEWVKKCYTESLKEGTTVVALLPARTDTARFHQYILGKAEIRFLPGRLTFVGAKDPAPFPSMIAIWRSNSMKKEQFDMATSKKKTDETNPLPSPEEVSKMNIYQKLSAVRLAILGQGTSKSGVNMHAEFTYFELVDIVPMAEVLFAKFHLFLLTTFTDGYAKAIVTDTDDPDSRLKFKVPLHLIAEPGKFRMNEVQGVGAAITYYRRYLYMLVLDLVEADAVDSLAPRKSDEADSPDEAPAPKPSRPTTAAERSEIKEELTSGEEMAAPESVAELKEALKQLLALDPEQENFVQEIALKTDSFQKIKAVACTTLIENVKDMLEAYTPGDKEEAE